MKFGILTFHRSRNYGAVLQAYALCYALNKLGVETEIIDYSCQNIEEKLKLWIPSKNIVKSILQFAFRFRKKLVFDSFERNILKKSKKLKRGETIGFLNYYDAIVVGSDQVWNEQITGNDNIYFLANINSGKIAYAVSVGDTIEISESALNYIKQFDTISVRERKLQKYLASEDIESCICCDPTILAGVDCFEQIVAPPLRQKGYVFVFMIWDSKNLLNNARKFAEINGLDIISSKGSIDFFLHCRPQEFLSWIKNAAYVFTNSFHGTVFSLLYHKKFVSSICKRQGESNLRIQELLTSVGCCSNILTDENCQVKNILEPDYNLIDKNLQKIRNDSLDYIKNALGFAQSKTFKNGRPQEEK